MTNSRAKSWSLPITSQFFINIIYKCVPSFWWSLNLFFLLIDTERMIWVFTWLCFHYFQLLKVSWGINQILIDSNIWLRYYLALYLFLRYLGSMGIKSRWMMFNFHLLQHTDYTLGFFSSQFDYVWYPRTNILLRHFMT